MRSIVAVLFAFISLIASVSTAEALPDLNPHLTIGAEQQVYEDGSVQVMLRAVPNSSNGVITVTIVGIPNTWTVSGQGTYNAATLTWTYTTAPGQTFQGGPTLSPPADSDVDLYGLRVTLSENDSATGQNGVTFTTIDVIVDAAADAPTVMGQNATGTENSAIDLLISGSAGDTDGSETIQTYQITGLPSGFSLSAGTDLGGGTWEVTPGQLAGLHLNVPASSQGIIPLQVTIHTADTISDRDFDLTNNTAQATSNFAVTITAALSATTVVPTTTLASGAAATPFIPVVGAGGTGTLAYSVSPLLPSGLQFNTATGEITGTPGAVLAPSVFTVTVTDSTNATASADFSLAVINSLAATTVVPTTTLSAGAPATPFTPVIGSGGVGPLTYSVSSSLPAGLQFNPATGEITGTPGAVLAATAFTVTVTDSTNATASSGFSLTVEQISSATTLTASPSAGYIGQTVILTATVAPSPSGGTINFLEGSSLLCAGVPVASGQAVCSTSFSSGGVHSVTATYSGAGSFAASTSAPLDITIADQVTKTVKAIGGFLKRRNDLIASQEPDTQRLIERLRGANQSEAGQPPAAFALNSASHLGATGSARGYAAPAWSSDGAQPSLGMLFGTTPNAGDGRAPSGMPFRLTGGSDSALQLGFATSLSEIRKSNTLNDRAKLEAAQGQSLGLIDTVGAPFSPFDIWIEGRYTSFSDGEDARDLDGHFGMMTVGADYVVSRSVLVGAFVQFDSMHEQDDAALTDVEGFGWLAGPYATVMLSDQLYWHGRAGWGRSRNEVSPYQTYTEDFDTSRWLVWTALSGRWNYGPWQFTPEASITYLEDKSESYVDTFGANIPSVKSSLGQAKAGPEVSYRYISDSGFILEPHAGVQLIWNFADEVTADGFADFGDALAGPEGIRGRVDAGFRAATPGGEAFDISGSFDGIGSGGYTAVSGRAAVRVPLN